jgi:hypothetical protein|tara:strand:+ start:104 stop:961 length:858 start_codon:yes stop_codon:yes gene_type:complete
MAIGRPVSLTNNVASKSISVTATENQTLFTVTGGYRVNKIAVFRNGARLVDGQDFTARDGATVTLIQGANLNDTLEFQIFDTFSVADAIQANVSNQTIDGNLTVDDLTATNITATTVTATTINGASIGIQSAGSVVGIAKTLNFIGAGNTFAVNGQTIDISIAGGGGGGGGGSIGLQSGGTRVATGITDVNIAIGSTTSRNITGSGTTATVAVDLGDYYIFRKPSVGFATMKVLIAGSGGGIAKSDYLGGSSYTGLSTANTDQFPWVAGIGMSISPLGNLIFTVP